MIYVGIAILVIVLIYLIVFGRETFGYTMPLIMHEFIPPHKLVGIKNSTLNAEDILEIQARKRNSKLDVTLREIIIHDVDGGDVNKFMTALRIAKNSNLKSITTEVLDDIFHGGGDIEAFVRVVKKAETAGLDFDLDELIQQKFDVGEMDKFIDAMVKSKRAGAEISQREMFMFYRAVGEVDTFTNAFIKSRKFDFNLPVDLFISLALTGEDIETFVNTIIKSKKMGLSIPIDKLVEHNLTGTEIGKIAKLNMKAHEAGLSISIDDLIDHARIKGDVQKMVEALIKAQELGLKTSLKELERFFIADGDIEMFIQALQYVKKSKLDITNDKLFELHLTGGDILGFVKSISLGKLIRVSHEEIEADFIQGRNVLAVTLAIAHAQKTGVDIEYSTGIMLDRMGHNVGDLVKQALNPKILYYNAKEEITSKETTTTKATTVSNDVNESVEHKETHEEKQSKEQEKSSIKVVAQNGIQMLIKPSVTVKLNIQQFLKGSGEDTLFERVNKAIIKEAEKYESHNDVLTHRKVISKRVLQQLLGESELDLSYTTRDKFTVEAQLDVRNLNEQEFNKHSKYEIIDLVIADISIGDDSFAQIKMKHAEHHAHELRIKAEAQVLNSKAEVQYAFAEAIKTGKITNINELHKHKIYNPEIEDVDIEVAHEIDEH